ncbi:MAG: DJ-1/PfpI family protein [Bacteroidia bacterium]|nr:DJ-1/PfpI family protein [Bacteroidia bacterium]NNF30318.1 glutamine amidotransferase [Flavobacteriaceae bacterium]MBT8276394.1 DJ-1/PfpI family protein [Bacteroidia bacterium]NNJ81761.1 glutamine amidotransferase [Flavobacteriaceae bacterium]NNK53537.1 glutamine amidotransferase [Flavobacteriaceae bacterium]
MRLLLILILFVALFSCGHHSEEMNHAAEAISETKKTFPKLDSTRYNVAFLIMDGVYNTELTAPYDIFQHTIFREGIKAMNVFTVANTDEAVTSFEGMRILPDFNYTKDPIPKIDILVVPSAEHHLDSDLEDEVMLEFVRKVDAEALFVTSHCDGAFVLAQAGLLNNSVCTTFPTDIDTMREMFPSLDIRKDVLFVHDGKYITSAGGAKSFEAALYLCEFLYGAEIAHSLAGGLVIDWDLSEVPHTVIVN